MAISWKGDAAHSFAAATMSPTMPTHAAGDMLLVIFSGKPFDLTLTGPSGFTSLGSGTSGTTAAGIDVGSMYTQVWYKEATSGSETVTITETGNTWNIAAGSVVAWQKDVAETWDTPVAVFGGDEDLGTSPSCTMASDPGVTANDGIQLVIGCNSDATTPVSSLAVTQTGVTFGTVTEDRDEETTVGGDMGIVTGHCLVTSGTGSAAPVVSATGTADPGSPRMEAAFVRLRVTAAAPTSYPAYSSSTMRELLRR